MNKKTWIVVADASRACLYDATDGEIRLVREIANPNGRARDQQLVTDRPGSLKKGKGRDVRSSFDPRTTPHEAETIRFARELGRVLDEAREGAAFRWLAIFAAPHFLGLLLGKLSRPVSDAVIATVDKDYVRIPEHERNAVLTQALIEAAARQRRSARQHV